jgi:hypothetical protein
MLRIRTSFSPSSLPRPVARVWPSIPHIRILYIPISFTLFTAAEGLRFPDMCHVLYCIDDDDDSLESTVLGGPELFSVCGAFCGAVPEGWVEIRGRSGGGR